MKNKIDELLFELYSSEIELPESTNRRLKEIYEVLEDHPTIKATSNKRNRMKRSTLALIAAILAMTLFAGTVFAYGLSHSELFQSIFGTGVSGNEDDRTYYSALGVEEKFPLNERVEVDEETAEQLVGEYIVPLDKEFSYAECTYTLHYALMDTNGVGYVTYTMSWTPELDNVIKHYSPSMVGIDPQYISNSEWVGTSEPYITVDDNQLSSYLLINENLSTENSAYLICAFTVNKPIHAGMDIVLNFDCRDDDSKSIRLRLSTDNLIPSVTFTNKHKQHSISLSPIGMAIKCIDHEESSCNLREIMIHYPDGSYIVRSHSQNILNIITSTVWCVSVDYDTEQAPNYQTVSYMFNRLVVPDEVIAITLDGTEYFKFE